MRQGALNIACFCIVVSSTAPASVADPIFYTWQGMVRGSLAGIEFPLSPFRIEAYGDTENNGGDPDLAAHVWHSDPAILEIQGVARVQFEFSTMTWWNPYNGLENGSVAIAHSEHDIMIGPVGPALRGWSGESSIGPVTQFGYWIHLPFDTTSGVFLPVAESRLMQFTAIVVPEPATVSLFVFAALAAAGALRRR